MYMYMYVYIFVIYMRQFLPCMYFIDIANILIVIIIIIIDFCERKLKFANCNSYIFANGFGFVVALASSNHNLLCTATSSTTTIRMLFTLVFVGYNAIHPIRRKYSIFYGYKNNNNITCDYSVYMYIQTK